MTEHYDHAAVAGALAACSVLLLWWAWTLAHHGVNVPYRDQWVHPLLHISYFETHGWDLGRLLSPYNDSRKFFPFFVSAIIAEIAGDFDPRREFGVYFALFLLGAGCLYKLGRAAGLSQMAAWLPPVVWCVGLWSPVTDYIHMFSIMFERLPPEIAMIAGLLVLIKVKNLYVASLFLSVLTIVAMLSFSSGLILWPLFIIAIFTVRLEPWRKKTAVALSMASLAAVAIILFLSDMRRRENLNSFLVGDAGFDAAVVTEFAFAFAGALFGRDPENAAMFGAVMVSFFLASAIAAFIFERGSIARRLRVMTPWLVLGGYAIGLALLTALGRWRFGVQGALRPDYIPHAVFLPIASIGLLLTAIVAHKKERVAVATVAAVLVLLALQAPFSVATKDRIVAFEARQKAGRTCAFLFPMTKNLECIHWVLGTPRVFEVAIGSALKSESLPWIRPATLSDASAGRMDAGANGNFFGWAWHMDADLDAVALFDGALQDGGSIAATVPINIARPDVRRAHAGAPLRTGWAHWDERSTSVKACAVHAYAVDVDAAVLYPLRFKGCDAGDGVDDNVARVR